MKLEAYSNTINSAIPWLGNIPYHWEIKPMHSLVSVCNQSNKGMLENNLLSLSYGRIIRKSIDAVDGLLPESFETYQIVERDDIVFRLTDLQNDKRSLRSAIVRERGIITSAYTAVKPRKVDSAFFAWLMRSYDSWKVFYGMGGGLRQSLKYDELKRLPILAPSLVEQISIATFLDNETARIDRLIEKQQQLIALLKEKRQAVISHAVTKGLDSNVPMKDSGIEWLGAVPEHWVVVRVKHLSTFITSGPRGWSEYLRDDAEAIFLQSGDLNDELRILPEKANRVKPPLGAEGVRTKARKGDVVVCITGANTGRVAVIDALPATTYINQHLSLIRFATSKVHPLFAGYSLSSGPGNDHFAISQYGLKEGLSLANVSEAPIALPPFGEQKEIVSKLAEELAKLDCIVKRSTEMVELLQERHTALISAAVTGKIDVRKHPSAQSTHKEVA